MYGLPHLFATHFMHSKTESLVHCRFVSKEEEKKPYAWGMGMNFTSRRSMFLTQASRLAKQISSSRDEDSRKIVAKHLWRNYSATRESRTGRARYFYFCIGITAFGWWRLCRPAHHTSAIGAENLEKEWFNLILCWFGPNRLVVNTEPQKGLRSKNGDDDVFRR